MKILNKKLTLLATLGILFVSSVSLAAETPEEKGLAIATKAHELDKGWGDSESTMQMILRKKKGKERTREMRSRTVEMSEDGDRSIIIFDDPADVKGTAMLTHAHKTESDDQWLFFYLI